MRVWGSIAIVAFGAIIYNDPKVLLNLPVLVVLGGLIYIAHSLFYPVIRCRKCGQGGGMLRSRWVPWRYSRCPKCDGRGTQLTISAKALRSVGLRGRMVDPLPRNRRRFF